MSQDSDALVVAAYAEKMLRLDEAKLGEEYYYKSLPLCVIDAVFSIGVRYKGTQNVVDRYCKYTNQQRIRVGDELPAVSEQESISAFCARPEQGDPPLMAEGVYQSRQRTSSKNGILKTEAVQRFAQCLRSQGVEYLQDVPRVADSEQFKTDVQAIPGQRSGISLQYFWMLAGWEEFIIISRIEWCERSLPRHCRCRTYRLNMPFLCSDRRARCSSPNIQASRRACWTMRFGSTSALLIDRQISRQAGPNSTTSRKPATPNPR